MKAISWVVLLRRRRRRALRMKFGKAHAENQRLWREAARDVDPFWIDWVEVPSPRGSPAGRGEDGPNKP